MLNAAVIGIGSMGKNHARVYSELENVNLVAVADTDIETRKIAQKLKCRFYTDYNEMIKKEKIDLASVAVPTKLHCSITMGLINKGINVLVEKPITTSILEAEKIIGAAKKKNVKLMVGHIERFNPAVIKLKELIFGGEIGEVSSVIAKRVGYFPERIEENIVIDMAVHDIDVFNYLFEATPDFVNARNNVAVESRRIEDYTTIFLGYGKTNVIIEANWISPIKIRKLEITGTKGYCELNYITQELTVYKREQKPHDDKYNLVGFKINQQGLETVKNEIEINKEEPLKLELKHFVDCVENGKKPLVDGEDGLNALKVALRVVEDGKGVEK